MAIAVLVALAVVGLIALTSPTDSSPTAAGTAPVPLTTPSTAATSTQAADDHNMTEAAATPTGQAATIASEQVVRDREAAAAVPATVALQARLDAATDGEPIRFTPDTATLTEQGDATLGRIVTVLRAEPTARVEVVGHTAVEIANPPLCLQLSQLRAEQVAVRLAAAGIDPGRLTAIGVSHSQPKPSAAASRRVELVALPE